jgi:hypothetical protein
MGLDAFVYCDCVEKNRLRTAHPFPDLLYICKNGSPEIRTKDTRIVTLHDEWMESSACRHKQMFLEGCYLGNVGLVELVFNALKKTTKNPANKYPVLWSKVVYSGTHTGDFLNLRDVSRLKVEVEEIQSISFRNQGLEESKAIVGFFRALQKLVKASLKVRKPIAF